MRFFDDFIHKLFFRFGLVVHNFRGTFLIASLIFTIFCACGFIWLEEQTTRDPEFVFSPLNAPWRYERKVLSSHWPLDEQSFYPGKSYDYTGYVDVIAVGHKDEYGRPNMLNLNYLDEVARINQYIIHNITIPVQYQGKAYDVSYTDLCMSNKWKCFLNDHLTMLMPKERWGNFSGPIAEIANDIITSEVHITYPIGWRGSEPIYFGALVGNPSLVDEAGHFDYASAIRLTYNTREQQIGNVSRIWRHRVADYLTNKTHPPSVILEFGLYHNESLPEGLQDVADALTPKFVGTCTILFTFCFAVSVVLINHGNGVVCIDWVRSKPVVACAGIWCPLLAIISGFGILLWLGSYYNAIVNVSPFLVLCIGIDDLFIMVSAWHRTSPKKSPQLRMAETLEEAAVAITITSITDILTFSVGVFTTLPSVRLFCMYTAVQVLITYIYQLTFFCPILAYAAEWEAKGLHCWTGRQSIVTPQTDSFWQLFFLGGSPSREQVSLESHAVVGQTDKTTAVSEAASKSAGSWQSKLSRAMRTLESTLEQGDRLHSHDIEETFVNKLFKQVIGPFLLKKQTQIAAFLLFIVYIGVAIAGCIQIQEGLNPQFLVRQHFYLADFYRLIDETFWQEGLQIQVVVNNPPDLYSQQGRSRVSSLLSSLESTPYTMAHNGTMLWLDAYETYLKHEMDDLFISPPNSSAEWYERARDWLVISGGKHAWEKDMLWGEEEEDYYQLKAFRFQIGLRNYRTPTDHTNSCQLMREIAAGFRDLNVTTFHEYYPFADQYLELKPALAQNLLLGLSMMLAVSLVMIPDWRCASAVVLAIASINIGVLGYMTLWGVRLDSVSMITVIMCIGFAVDLSAHIAYAFSQAYGTAHERAVEALETLGWPVFNGAFSTIIGILVLTLVDSYIVQIFFKTVFLVISFSMLHGLVFLPVLLMWIVPGERRKRTTRQEKVPAVDDAVDMDELEKSSSRSLESQPNTLQKNKDKKETMPSNRLSHVPIGTAEVLNTESSEGCGQESTQIEATEESCDQEDSHVALEKTHSADFDNVSLGSRDGQEDEIGTAKL